jgi:hypothetical protein
MGTTILQRGEKGGFMKKRKCGMDVLEVNIDPAVSQL